ncbi:MAG: hypothetical protein M0042_10690 [Nitrospiraceae bacterium]|nr:hypothetical protein [Nitrospiraceae bacterium]
MERTRKSLYYVVAYLLLGGAGLLVAPAFVLGLFFSRGGYSDVMVRFVGLLLLALGILVLQIIRHRVRQLYASTVVVRLMILAGLAVFYYLTADPLMIVLFGIVALGVAMTILSLILDGQSRKDRGTR